MNNRIRLTLSLILGVFLLSGTAQAGNMMKESPGTEMKTETKMMGEEQTMKKDSGMMDESKMKSEETMKDSGSMGMKPEEDDSMTSDGKMDKMPKM